MSEDFLSRWSRRKLEARKAEPEPAPPRKPDIEALAEPSAREGASAGAEPVSSPEIELSEEEIANLPSLDELTADTDISVFLRKGVPESLRNAALRRMWSLDPSIRDFVSEAREYAYDWNTPGGVPGFGGALPSAEQIQKLVARIVGGTGSESASDPAAPPPASAAWAESQIRESSSPELKDDTNGAAQQGAIAVPEHGAARHPDFAESSAAEPFAPEAASTPNVKNSSAAQQNLGTGAPEPARRRKHGGAKPS